MECTTGIYIIKNKINNKFYIGSAVNIRTRWNTHRCQLRNGKHNNQYLSRSWNKYKEKNFEFIIIEICKKEELNERELYHINTLYPEFNLMRNDRLSEPYIFSLETRQKMSESAKKRKRFPMSQVTKDKISKLHKGRKLSLERKQQISECRKGKKLSQEHKDSISKATKGLNTWMTGKKISPEIKAKIKATRELKNYTYEYLFTPEARKKAQETKKKKREEKAKRNK